MTAPITTAVNLTWVAPGRVGGSEEYLVRQLSGLPDDGSVEPRLFCHPAFVAAHPALCDRFPTVPLPFERDWRAGRIVAEHTWLAVRSHRADVVHHGGGTVPLLGERPVLVTIHDLQYLRFPQYFGRARRRYLDAMMPRSVRRAELVATPSEYVRGTVVDAFGVDADRVVVIPHGIPDLAPPAPAGLAATRARYGIGDRPYVVYPAITHPHKRHRVLVEMLAHLDPDLLLVLPGGEGGAEPDLRRAIGEHGVGRRVIRPGRVSDGDRDALVAGADALLFPSEYEGFGAPVVEAMALGTPVACSDNPALREVVGDAAIVVSTSDPEAWAAAVGEARSRREELVAAGARRRERYTLAASGRALADAYRRVAAR